MKYFRWQLISPAKHSDPHVVAEVLRGQVDMLVAGRQYTVDGSVVEIGSIGSLSQMGIQLVPEVDKPTVKTVQRPMFEVGDSVRVTNRSLPLHLHVGHLIAEDVGGRFLFECAGTNRKGWVSQEDLQGVPEGWVPRETPQPEPSANVPESPHSSVDHSADADKMVEDEYREPTEDDVLDGPIQCEVRNGTNEEWVTERLKYVDNTLRNFRFQTGNPSPHDGLYFGRLKSWKFARIKKASLQPPQPEPVAKQSLTPDTPDQTKITIGYTVHDAYGAGAEPITEPIERKRVLYIAGPMRGIAWFNYPMFDRVRNHLTEAGNEVISPADEDRKHDGFNPFANPEYQIPDACVFPKEMDFHKTVRRCLDAVLRCDEIVLLPGWENSNGAVAELTLAMWLGKRVRHLKIANNGEFYWSYYWMGLAGMAVKLRDHHIPEVEAPAPVVVYDEDDEEDILDTAARITRGDRNASYGPPDQDFRRTAGMWSALFQAKLKDGATFEPRDVAMAMILLKCSRESHQRKLDNWVDIAGYARCGSKCN